MHSQMSHMWRRSGEKDPAIKPESCYEKTVGVSGETYTFGFKKVVQRLGVAHAIFENVKAVANKPDILL